MEGTTIPPQTVIVAEDTSAPALPANPSPSKQPNAFTELMSARTKKHRPTPANSKSTKAKAFMQGIFDPRDGLITYIKDAERNPEGRVVEYDDDFVVIKDKYPKASVHLLLLPRNPAYYFQHPLEILSNNHSLLSEIQTRVGHLKDLVAGELRRLYGPHSISDHPYQAALEEIMSRPDPPLPEVRTALLPPGRDWHADVIAGVHTHPSMNHLHIHILSREMYSPWLKHKKHYLSFTTSFFVQLHELPLQRGSERLHPGDWPNWDMKCWRCGKNFANQFKRLKEHLDDEYEEWKKE